jgi:ssDNA-binding Zn-finger/Zn-ribbon topoisomerase 1
MKTTLPVDSPVASESDPNALVCPDCGRPQMRRLPRHGFLQQVFWPRLGFYPWECPICRKLRMVRFRGKRKKRASAS